MRAVSLLVALGLAACAPQDGAQNAERDMNVCAQFGAPQQRLRACSALAANADAPIEYRVRALIERGVLRIEMAQYARGIADLGRALRLDSRSTRALVERGMAHRDRGAFEAAVRDFDAALRLDPHLQVALTAREQSLAGAAGAFSVELDRLSRAIAAAPDDSMLLNNRCWVRAINGRELELALADCDESLRIEPNSAAVHDSRGLVNLKLERYEAALADYDAAIAIDPGVAHYSFGRGAALVALGREDEGRAVLAEASAQDELVAGLYASYGVTP